VHSFIIHTAKFRFFFVLTYLTDEDEGARDVASVINDDDDDDDDDEGEDEDDDTRNNN